MNRNI